MWNKVIYMAQCPYDAWSCLELAQGHAFWYSTSWTMPRLYMAQCSYDSWCGTTTWFLVWCTRKSGLLMCHTTRPGLLMCHSTPTPTNSLFLSFSYYRNRPVCEGSSCLTSNRIGWINQESSQKCTIREAYKAPSTMGRVRRRVHLSVWRKLVMQLRYNYVLIELELHL